MYKRPRYLFKSPESYEVNKNAFIDQTAQDLGIKSASLLLPRQTHSSNVWVLSKDHKQQLISGKLKSIENCDAIICSRGTAEAAIGIQSADCAPILGATEHQVFAIHAGWIGLRDEIVKKTLLKLNPYTTIEFFVGPCATYNYERDLSEIESIPQAIYTQTVVRKGNLNVKETAVAQIKSAFLSDVSIITAPECTVSDGRWLSYRRSSLEYQRRNIEGGFAKVRGELSARGIAVNNISCVSCF